MRSAYFVEMSGSSRKRSSKWDLKEESNWHGKTGMPYHDRESHGLLSPHATGGNQPKWSSMEPVLGRRGSQRDDNIDDDRNRAMRSMTLWDDDESYGTRMSPGLEEWRQQTHRHSPKNEWKRSRRSQSRSRTRSRSRSRSRSPVHGSKRDSGMYDRNRSRSTISAQFCKDFAAGRCRRGNHCPFFHEGPQSCDESWERHGKTIASKYSTSFDSREYPLGSGRSSEYCTEFLKGSCRRGVSCRFAHHGAANAPGKGSTNEVIAGKSNDRRNRYASPERHSEHDTRRTSDVPCKFFAAGNCRNGKYCRFSHHDQALVSPERRVRDSRWSRAAQNSDHVENLWSSPKWSDANTSLDATKLREDKHEKVDASELSEPVATCWSMDNKWSPNLDGNKTLNVPPINHKVFESDKNETRQPWMESVRDNACVSEQRPTDNWLGDMDTYPEWDYKVHPPKSIDKQELTSLPNYEPVLTHEASGIVPIVNETAIQQDYNLREMGANSLRHDEKGASRNTSSSNMNISADVLPSDGFNQNCLTSNALPIPLLNVVGHGQAAVVNDPSRGESMVAQSRILFQEGKSVKQDIEESNAGKGRSDIPTTQNLVNREQLTQLTNLSASLAQLLANGQHLPQLYAAHNPQNGVDTPSLAKFGEPLKPDSVVTVQSSQDGEHQKQLDPTSAIFDPVKHSAGTDDGNGNGNCHQLHQLESGAGSDATKERSGVKSLTEKTQEEKTAQESGPLDNIDGDGKTDENKKSKDAKGIRAFKFALVEFVKDALKPAWKEGHMDKDAYKNIVKKVVDKVTGSMQGAHIPQTQEKIEHYLSVSKPKLTKLIEAYLEKIQKEK